MIHLPFIFQVRNWPPLQRTLNCSAVTWLLFSSFPPLLSQGAFVISEVFVEQQMIRWGTRSGYLCFSSCSFAYTNCYDHFLQWKQSEKCPLCLQLELWLFVQNAISVSGHFSWYPLTSFSCKPIKGLCLFLGLGDMTEIYIIQIYINTRWIKIT